MYTRRTDEQKKIFRKNMRREFGSAQTLYGNGLKRTPTRIVVFDIFREQEKPISIQEIRVLAAKRLPESTLWPAKLPNPATIYRTIVAFERVKMIQRVGNVDNAGVSFYELL